MQNLKDRFQQLSMFHVDFWNPFSSEPWTVCWAQLPIFKVFEKMSDTNLSSKRSKIFQLTLGPFHASCNNLFFSSSLIDSYRPSNKFSAVGLLRNCVLKYFVPARPVFSFQKRTATSIWQIWISVFKLSSKETVKNDKDFTS